jgi:hypothetical protein
MGDSLLKIEWPKCEDDYTQSIAKVKLHNIIRTDIRQIHNYNWYKNINIVLTLHGKRQLGGLRRRWEHNINIFLRETGYEIQIELNCLSIVSNDKDFISVVQISRSVITELVYCQLVPLPVCCACTRKLPRQVEGTSSEKNSRSM